MLRCTLLSCAGATASRRSAAAFLRTLHSKRGGAAALRSSSGLAHMVRAYATTTPPLAGSHYGAAGENVPGSGGDREATAAHLHHAPTLRSALPPSAVELPEESLLKCIEKEIFDEKVRLDKEDGPPPVPLGWTMHHTEGTSFIYGRRLWMPPPSSSSSSPWSRDAEARRSEARGSPAEEGREKQQVQQRELKPAPRPMERHFLRIQLTSRDASLDPECDVRGEHFPFSFFVQRIHPEEGNEEGWTGTTGSRRGEQGAAADDDSQSAPEDDSLEPHSFYHNSIEARCDVVDGELVVDGVVYHGPPPPTSQPSSSPGAPRPRYTNPFGGYPGPNLDEAEEEVLDGIHGWLAERGVDDQLGEFVGQYSIWVEQAEYELWLQQLRDYVAA
ncbi:hypothetical protein LSCM1_07756 [Leishmania martiniquensis]|uniref:Mitochondrial glycoprotein-like protein n=1 Tax=Leishmania martiniquensis TaxID=1580590 RepID=A0A836KY15_9TRYP|nr:hypothetical protein LSCM1_07756 [Leishmania martiniquensis]